MSTEALVRTFRRLSLGIKTINLGYNKFDYLSMDDCYRIFYALPTHVSNLSLIGSHFDKYEICVIKQLLVSIPLHIKFIDLSENGLDEMIPSQADELASVLPVDTSLCIGYAAKGSDRAPIIIKGKKILLEALKLEPQVKPTTQRPSAISLPDLADRRASKVGDKPERSTGTLKPSPPMASTFFPSLDKDSSSMSRGARTKEAAQILRK